MSNDFSRRDFLRWTSAGAGAAAVGGGVWIVGRNAESGRVDRTTRLDDAAPRSTDAAGSSEPAPRATDELGPTPTELPAAPVPTGDPGARRLVIIEMEGGNDGLSMVVPYGLGRYYDLRSRTAVNADDVLDLDGTFGLHPNLSRLRDRGGVAVVQGVGSATPDLSHFEMMDRWWNGDPDGSRAYSAGVVGRLADVIAAPEAAAVAVSLGRANHPTLASLSAPTLAMGSPGGGGYLAGADEGVWGAYQRAIRAFAGAGGDGWLGRIRGAQAQAASFAGKLLELETTEHEASEGGAELIEYPYSTLAEGLRAAAQLFTADPFVRVVHVPMGANFDTHDDHLDPYAQMMAIFDEAVEAFRRDLERRGLDDSVVIMTTSEFGRRIADNGSNGLDHGTASTALLIGPVNNGIFGEFPDLDTRDDTDNLMATTSFDRYYASVFSGWLGADPAAIFNGTIEPIPGLFG